MAKIKLIDNNWRTWRSDLPLVIGYFNCIHTMHIQLLTKYNNFNVLTFNDFHTKSKNRIYSFKERIDNIEKYKPESIYILDLNKFNMTGLDFVIKVLRAINPSHIVVGEDFTFGSDHKDVDFLKNYFNVDVIKYNKHISTTNIVKDIKNGQLTRGNLFLDEPYYYVSKWIGGRKLGRKLGFRTVNLQVKQNLIIPDGVYITTTEIGSKKYNSISFIGTSHTTGSETRTVESHILNKIILPRTVVPRLIRNYVKVSFLKFIRKNKKFSSSQKLITQLNKDKAVAIKYFKENI